MEKALQGRKLSFSSLFSSAGVDPHLHPGSPASPEEEGRTVISQFMERGVLGTSFI